MSADEIEVNTQVISKEAGVAEPSSLPPKIKRNYWKVGFFVILVLWFLTILGFVYFLEGKEEKAKMQEEASSPATYSTSLDKDLEIPPGWEKYENQDYYFTILYPGNWVVEEGLIQEMKVASRFECVAGYVDLVNEDKGLIAHISYRYPEVCSNLGLRTGMAAYEFFSEKKILNVQGVEIPYFYAGESGRESPIIKEVFYNDSEFIKIGDLEFLFEVVSTSYNENLAIDERLIEEEINPIFATLEVPKISEPLERESILGVAYEYFQAITLVGGEANSALGEKEKAELWEKIERLCADPNFNRDVVSSYKIAQIDMVDSWPDENPERYHILVDIFANTDENLEKPPRPESKEILMVKEGGNWKVATWRFFE